MKGGSLRSSGGFWFVARPLLRLGEGPGLQTGGDAALRGDERSRFSGVQLCARAAAWASGRQGGGEADTLAQFQSALALLVAGVLADDHDAAVATNHLALVTHR